MIHALSIVYTPQPASLASRRPKCATGFRNDSDVEIATSRAFVAQVAIVYMKPLRTFFARRCRNSADVDDLVQQVMLRILACEATGDVRHVGAYVFKTAAHVLADQKRRGRVREADSHVEFDAERHGDQDHDPSQIAESRQVLGLVSEALAQLPTRSRAIFLERRLENRPYRDIAAQHDISVSAVEKHMIRSTNHLTALRDREFAECP